jgi:hypothetical protein
MLTPVGRKSCRGFAFGGGDGVIPSAGAEWGRISLVNWGVAGTIRAHARPPS